MKRIRDPIPQIVVDRIVRRISARCTEGHCDWEITSVEVGIGYRGKPGQCATIAAKCKKCSYHCDFVMDAADFEQ